MYRLVVSLILTTLAAPLTAQAKVDFKKQIWPIFQKKCIECHSAPKTDASGRVKKPKGRVEMDTKSGIKKSKRGKLVKAGKPDDSLLYEMITLPADDEDIMPPPKKGKPLTAKEIGLIKTWIEQGANYGTWTGEKPGSKAAKSSSKGRGKADKPKVSPLISLAKGLKPVDAKTLAGIGSGTFKISSVGDDNPLLQVTCYGETDGVDDATVEALLPIAKNIAELNLGATQITDEACKTIAKMPNLVSLDLRRTEVGNHGVASLINCKELRTLNLYGTKVGDYGATALSKLTNLEEIYVWQTEVSDSGIKRLRESIAGCRVVAEPQLPPPMEDSGNNRRRRRQ